MRKRWIVMIDAMRWIDPIISTEDRRQDDMGKYKNEKADGVQQWGICRRLMTCLEKVNKSRAMVRQQHRK